jgi:ArsR family transcriptional regulator
MANREQVIDKCDCVVIHEEVVDKTKRLMPNEEVFFDLADLFKVLSDSTRIRILWSLITTPELCVCDISALLNMTQSAISHQLRLLKQANLVRNRRDGKIIYYSLSDDHVKHILDQGFTHISERN